MNNATHKVLIVEDDPSIASELVRGLKDASFEVELVTNGLAAVNHILATPPDLVVLDLGLPELSGFDVLERVRGRCPAPIIALTARTDLTDRLKCFGLGADDFLAKPFWIEELIARIRSRLRIRESEEPNLIRFDDVAVDLDNRLVYVALEPVALTRAEFEVLAYLLARPGRAITREQLATAALPPEGDRTARTVDSHIARIRKKLGSGGSRIATVWSLGYRFNRSVPKEQ